LTRGKEEMEKHKQKWAPLRKEAEKWLKEKNMKYFSNSFGITYWVKTPLKDTLKWTNEHAVPRYKVTPVPGTFFLFKDGYKLEKSSMVRLGLGAVNPDGQNLLEALEAFEEAVKTGA
ncbi:MAG: hypothetical protein QW840_04775, partial [Candidatus Bathyarchaeia archaeon]